MTITDQLKTQSMKAFHSCADRDPRVDACSKQIKALTQSEILKSLIEHIDECNKNEKPVEVASTGVTLCDLRYGNVLVYETNHPERVTCCLTSTTLRVLQSDAQFGADIGTNASDVLQRLTKQALRRRCVYGRQKCDFKMSKAP